MTNNAYTNIWNNAMAYRTIEARINEGFNEKYFLIKKTHNVIIKATMFDVNEYTDDDITTTWLEAKRYVTIHLSGIVAFEYEEKVVIDYEHNEMYVDVEGFDIDTCGIYIH